MVGKQLISEITFAMRSSNAPRRTVVEDCEIVKCSESLRCQRLCIGFSVVPTRGRGHRSCLLCPACGRRAFKLYKPRWAQAFACRSCHNLSYISVQKHDARLDRLLRMPDREIVRLISRRTHIAWTLLAIRAAYIRLGLISKY